MEQLLAELTINNEVTDVEAAEEIIETNKEKTLKKGLQMFQIFVIIKE